MAHTRRILALLFVAAMLAAVPSIAFGQEADGGMRETTSGGTLDIVLEQTWNEEGNASFRIMFLEPGSDQVHEHQDYDVIIRQGDTQVFSAAGQLNQAILHNVEGTITIPYQFEQNGDYTVEVQLLGLGFPPIPINPETATFPITVVPEFPAGLVVAVTSAVVAGSIALTRKFKSSFF